ncbi:MAG: IMP dehydrogenase [Bacteroidetes bacterium]|nr:IMP dehydrogenase [Bacteroidota bacterium]
MREALTFDDVFIVPGYSEVESRSTVNLEAQLTRNHRINVPLIAAPMDSVCDGGMAHELSRYGVAGALHRFCTVEENVEMLTEYLWGNINDVPAIVSVGAVGVVEWERLERSVDTGAKIILVDVAHGDHVHVKRLMERVNKMSNRSQFDVILGNIATAEAAQRLEDWGADALRVGIGGGSMCTTRVRTGIGVPQITAIQNVCSVASVPVISDGGIRSSGDVAKALAAGADTVMIGSLLAGTDEAPGNFFVTGDWPNEKKFKVYRGSASMSIKLATKGTADNVEGTATLVPVKGPVANVVKTLCDGIRSSMSYVGAMDLTTFRQNAIFVQVTNAGLAEAHPHGLK